LHLDFDHDFPKLQKKRSNNSSFVLKDFLFVVFGTQEDIEYLDLNENFAKFTTIGIQDYQKF